MSTDKSIQLTEGSIFQGLVKLALPIMASAFLATAYSIVDMMWIGRLGAKAVAGVGVGGMFVWLSQGIATLARMGGQVQVGQAVGRKDYESAKKYGTAAIQLVLLLGVAFGIICFAFSDVLVGFFGLTDAETIRYGKTYLCITCGLIVFSYLGAVLTGVYTAQGDSKTPLKANSIGLITNMILDPVLIFGLGPVKSLGVTGAAVATVLAQWMVAMLLLPGVLPTKAYENVLKYAKIWKPLESKIYKDVVRIGLPSALQTCMYCFFSMLLTRMVASFGENGIAVQRVGGQIESISWNTADGFAAAMNAFAAQNYGAGKFDRVKKGYQISAFTMFIWGTLVGLSFNVFPLGIAGIFFHEAKVISIAIGYLMVIGIGEPFMCVEIMGCGALSGLGDTKLCSVISIILTALRIPLALFLSRTALGIQGIWWALTISSMLKGFTFHITFHKRMKMLTSKM